MKDTLKTKFSTVNFSEDIRNPIKSKVNNKITDNNSVVKNLGKMKNSTETIKKYLLYSSYIKSNNSFL